MSQTVIPVTELTEARFAVFGRIIRCPADTPPTRSGEGWQAWYGHEALQCPDPLTFGSVVTQAREIVVDSMERHVHTFELLYPHGHELIQPLAPPEALSDPDAHPSADKVVAFRIPPGEAIVMHPGTWHSPAFPASQTCTYTFACLEPSFPYVPEWIPFQDESIVRVST